jgi:hypothetical protein
MKRYALFLFPFGFGLALGGAVMRLHPQSGIELWGLTLFIGLAVIAFVEISRG